MAPCADEALEALPDRMQRAALDHGPQAANPTNGWAADTSRKRSPVGISVAGFALSAYPAAVARLDGSIRRSHAPPMGLRFLRDSGQRGSSTAPSRKSSCLPLRDIHAGTHVAFGAVGDRYRPSLSARLLRACISGGSGR